MAGFLAEGAFELQASAATTRSQHRVEDLEAELAKCQRYFATVSKHLDEVKTKVLSVHKDLRVARAERDQAGSSPHKPASQRLLAALGLAQVSIGSTDVGPLVQQLLDLAAQIGSEHGEQTAGASASGQVVADADQRSGGRSRSPRSRAF